MGASYTIKNLREVEDSATKFGFAENQEARFAHGDLEAESTGFALERVKPSKRHAFAHRHSEAEEVYVILSGDGRVKLDDDIRDVRALDAIRVAPGVTRQFEAGGDGLELLVFGPRHERDAEIVPDFWED